MVRRDVQVCGRIVEVLWVWRNCVCGAAQEEWVLCPATWHSLTPPKSPQLRGMALATSDLACSSRVWLGAAWHSMVP